MCLHNKLWDDWISGRCWAHCWIHWWWRWQFRRHSARCLCSFAMSQRFYPVSARNWFTLDWVQLQSNGSMASFVGSRAISAPAEYSFHCGTLRSFRDALLVPNSTEQSVADWRLNFIDFQVSSLHAQPRPHLQTKALSGEHFRTFSVLFTIHFLPLSGIGSRNSHAKMFHVNFLLTHFLTTFLHQQFNSFHSVSV